MPASTDAPWVVTADEYHADHSHVGRSMAEVFRKSRRLYEARYVTRTLDVPPPSDAMVRGTLMHMAALEPERFASRVACKPTFFKDGEAINRRLKAHREYLAEWLANVPDGSIIATRGEAATAQAMGRALRGNPAIRQFLDAPGQSEVAIRWVDEHGLPRKAMFDRLAEYRGHTCLVDLKSARQWKPDPFARQVVNLGYHRQLAWYAAGARAVFDCEVQCLLVVVHAEPPYETVAYDLSADFLQLGRDQNERTCRQLAECYASGDWSDPEHGRILTLQMPGFALTQDQWEVEP